MVFIGISKAFKRNIRFSICGLCKGKSSERRTKESGNGGGKKMYSIWGEICRGFFPGTGRLRGGDYQRDGAGNRRDGTPGSAHGRWKDIRGLGLWGGYMLSQRTYRALRRHFRAGRRDYFGVSAGYAALATAFSSAKPDHQRVFRLCFAGGFQRENKSKCGAFTHL